MDREIEREIKSEYMREKEIYNQRLSQKMRRTKHRIKIDIEKETDNKIGMQRVRTAKTRRETDKERETRKRTITGR